MAAQEGAQQQAQGAFDWELNGKTTNRVSGYYDGKYLDSQVTRRLSESGTRVYGGYRLSDGDFPIYEDENITRDAGEFNAGIVQSLWRDRILDKDRAAFADAKLALAQEKSVQLLTQMGVQHSAMSAYLDWLMAGKAMQVAESLVKIAEKRQSAFSRRVEKGDIAAIYLTENQQYILKRKADLTEAERIFRNAGVKLSLFWRDAKGNPQPLTSRDLPKDFPDFNTPEMAQMTQEIEQARLLRPEVKMLALGQEREKLKLQLGENRILPKVDFVAEGGRDIGDGFANRAGTEAKIGFNVSIPLQQNIGLGQMAEARAKLKQIEQKQRLLGDKIAAEIRAVANDFDAAKQYRSLTEQEVAAARKMEAAERQRFDDGLSDFFVINMREERTASARLSNLAANTKFWKAVADYYLATLKPEKLLITDAN